MGKALEHLGRSSQGLETRWSTAELRAARVQGLADEIDALRMIFMVNERAMFEFIVTEASLREVVNPTCPGYTQWVYDVLDTWLILSEDKEPPTPGRTLRTGVSA